MEAAPDRFTLAIHSGLYEGVVETLAEGRYRIGSDIGADLVLVEDGIAAQQLVIGLAGRFARLEALADGVALESIGPLLAGEARDVPLPTELVIERRLLSG